MTRLHEPQEGFEARWDGFPLDSTYSRGRIDSDLGMKKRSGTREIELSAYDVREYFDEEFGVFHVSCDGLRVEFGVAVCG